LHTTKTPPTITHTRTQIKALEQPSTGASPQTPALMLRNSLATKVQVEHTFAAPSPQAASLPIAAGATLQTHENDAPEIESCPDHSDQLVNDPHDAAPAPDTDAGLVQSCGVVSTQSRSGRADNARAHVPGSDHTATRKPVFRERRTSQVDEGMLLSHGMDTVRDLDVLRSAIAQAAISSDVLRPQFGTEGAQGQGKDALGMCDSGFDRYDDRAAQDDAAGVGPEFAPAYAQQVKYLDDVKGYVHGAPAPLSQQLTDSELGDNSVNANPGMMSITTHAYMGGTHSRQKLPRAMENGRQSRTWWLWRVMVRIMPRRWIEENTHRKLQANFVLEMRLLSRLRRECLVLVCSCNSSSLFVCVSACVRACVRGYVHVCACVRVGGWACVWYALAFVRAIVCTYSLEASAWPWCVCMQMGYTWWAQNGSMPTFADISLA
jgi:hypothetical protein